MAVAFAVLQEEEVQAEVRHHLVHWMMTRVLQDQVPEARLQEAEESHVQELCLVCRQRWHQELQHLQEEWCCDHICIHWNVRAVVTQNHLASLQHVGIGCMTTST